jgi:hypothetical protein
MSQIQKGREGADRQNTQQDIRGGMKKQTCMVHSQYDRPSTQKRRVRDETWQTTHGRWTTHIHHHYGCSDKECRRGTVRALR